jgi:glyoxylase-like metal-dependent hydrolase (beta-lactamase superfamily II)
MKFGDFEVLPQTDGFFRLDGGAMFGVVPKPLWQKRTEPDDRNRIRLGLRPLLGRTPDHTVLIDAGIGGKMSPKEVDIYGVDRTVDLAASLASSGHTVADVDVVIATHLHFDHAGGFTVAEGERVEPAFPNATYYIRRGEWDDATHPHERNKASYLAENFVPLEQAGVLRFTDDDQEILPGIRVQRTGGHTMHHQLVRLESGGRTGVFVADLIPTTAHVDEPWIMGYDLYPMDTLAFKKQFIREAIDREYVIFFEHDPAMSAGIIREHQGRKFVEPVFD